MNMKNFVERVLSRALVDLRSDRGEFYQRYYFYKINMELFEHPEFSNEDFFNVYSITDFPKMKVVAVKNRRWSNYITIVESESNQREFNQPTGLKILSCKKKRRHTISDEKYLDGIPVTKDKLTYKIISSLYDLDERV